MARSILTTSLDRRTRRVRLVAVVAGCGLVAGACGGGDGATATTLASVTTQYPAIGVDDSTGLPVFDPLDTPEGDVAIAGSSTVFPLSTAIMSLWEDEGGPGYAIDSIGSGGGFERFCVEGASDIANASRSIKGSEVDACAALDPPRVPIEIRVGTDALAVVISRGNSFAQQLTIEQIAAAFSLTKPDATWADVDPSFPAHPIQLFTPGADSGTFDYFNEAIFDEADPSPILSSIAQIVGEDDNVTVQGVAQDGCTQGDPSTTCAIGYFGYAYFAENASVLRAVRVEGIEPNDDTVNAGQYPLARPLYMYTDAGVIARKPQVAQFITFYLNRVDEVIGEVGYFPAPADAITEAADRVREAAGF